MTSPRMRWAIALTAVLALATSACTAPPETAPATTTADGSFSGPVGIGDDRELYLHCTGEGTPTVILESGYHDSSSLWSVSEPVSPATGPSVQERLSRHVRTCSYDRPGTLVYGDELAITTRSTPVTMPRPTSAAVDDLHALLAAADLPVPVVLIAHSMGGLIARQFAQTHPGEVAGIVFVDAFPAEMHEAMGDLWNGYAELLDRPGTPFDDDPGWEVFDLDESIDAVVGGPVVPDVPMFVISKTEPFPLPEDRAALSAVLESAWVATAQDLVMLGTRTPHLIATGSDHYVQVRDPDLVAGAALIVIERIRGASG